MNTRNIVAALALTPFATLGADIQNASAPAAVPPVTYESPGNAGVWVGLAEYADAMGKVAVVTTGEAVNTATHPFFKAAPNGRACVSCHQPSDAMSLSLDTIRARWQATQSSDPLFAAFDGSNCPSLPQDLRSSHSLLLDRGVFRIAMPWPPRALNGTPITPEFSLEAVSDPTGCNTSATYGLTSAHPTVSVYRRPRMVANLRYVDTPKYDYNAKTMMPMDRDPQSGARSSMSMLADGRATSLKQQADDAARTHLQLEHGMPAAQLDRLVDFEQRLYVAQNYSNSAGDLTEAGGPPALGVDAMIHGKDHLNGNDADTGVFFFFNQWKSGGANPGPSKDTAEFRASVARGYDIFFHRAFWISDTVGINNIRLGNPYKQTCGFCHNSQLTGIDDVPGWMDLGTANFPHANAAPDLPMFKVTCKAQAGPHPYLGRVIYTTDPGRALISGRCEDVGGIVMQQFRGISARAPYFANGSAKSLREVVDFYDRRFTIGFTDQEKQDLINFLTIL